MDLLRRVCEISSPLWTVEDIGHPSAVLPEMLPSDVWRKGPICAHGGIRTREEGEKLRVFASRNAILALCSKSYGMSVDTKTNSKTSCLDSLAMTFMPGYEPETDGSSDMISAISYFSGPSRSYCVNSSHKLGIKKTKECGLQGIFVSSISFCPRGSKPRPGEITLAHQGVLFLDELPEFDRKVLEVLREPLESGEIVIARANDRVRFPARFQLVAAMNPCPCGYLGDSANRCRCTPEQIQRYRAKLSGPLLDRIDLHLTVAREATSLDDPPPGGQDSASAAADVARARQRQLDRQGCANAFLDLQGLRRHCPLPEEDRRWLEGACERLGLSLRAAHRIIKVARTLADLEDTEAVARHHLAEALQYRPSSEP
ncbi:ATP-binding protein [Pseudomonas tohonis]|uniref:ATP-binding protein n=1 Tax=Pseudomonas tohonis TaxID=2725477 RepID=UPI0027E1BE8B|nr:ATP-binding protein [Pseudomonas tohonis]